MNRLDELPRGFGSFPVLEVLDITYNNISEGDSLPGNFFMLGKLKTGRTLIVLLFFMFLCAVRIMERENYQDSQFKSIPTRSICIYWFSWEIILTCEFHLQILPIYLKGNVDRGI